MASSRQSLALFVAAVVGQNPYLEDPSLVPAPPSLKSFDSLCRPPQLGRKIRIGIFRSDGVVAPQPPIQRAMTWTEDRLRRSGTVELVQMAPFQPGRAQRLSAAIFAANGQNAAKETLGDEELTPLTAKVMSKEGPAISVGELYKLTAARDAFRLEFAKYWNEAGIDLLLCPNAHSPAPPHDTSGYVGYTVLFNLLAYPAATFPTGLRVEKSDTKDPKYTPLNKLDRICQDAWNPEVSVGAPLGLQLVSKPWTDDFLLSSLAVVEEAISR